ncbi:MAG TPA: Hsp70 family protein, partial [Iamia sp.]|nr:Hsp70 family protein [Iamia sp.]
DQMIKDAEAHAEEDRKRKEAAEARNQADTLVYQTEKVLREQGDKVSGSEKEAAEAALAELKTALEGDDAEAIKAGTEKLMTASQSLTQALYEQAKTENDGAYGGDAAGAGATAGGSDDDVVDAEVVDDGDEPKSV